MKRFWLIHARFEPETELRGYFVEQTDACLEPRAEEVHLPISLSLCDYQRICLQYLSVVHDRPVIDAEPACKLVQVERPLPQLMNHPSSIFTAPRAPQHEPEQALELGVFGQEGLDVSLVTL